MDVREWLKTIPAAPERLLPSRYEAAMGAARPRVLAHALIGFVIGMSLDDLHVLRYPGWLVGVGWLVLWIAIGPLILGHITARRLDGLIDRRYHVRLRLMARSGLLFLLFTIVTVVVWLVFFSSGVPPWAK